MVAAVQSTVRLEMGGPWAYVQVVFQHHSVGATLSIGPPSSLSLPLNLSGSDSEGWMRPL